MAGPHLTAFFKEPRKAIELIPVMFREASLVPLLPEQSAYNDSHPKNPHFVGFTYPNAPTCFFFLVEKVPGATSDNLRSIYPFLKDGVPHTLEVLDLKPDPDDIEGVLETVNSNAVPISFFAPLFSCHRQVCTKGRKFEFSIAALAYRLEQITETKIRITEGPLLELERFRRKEEDPNVDLGKIDAVEMSMAEYRAMDPAENGEDAGFQTVVDEVATFQMMDISVCKMSVVLMRMDSEDFRIALYATDHVLNGYRPKVGDCIRGVLWLQGYPIRPIEDPANWGDRLTANSPQYEMEGVERACAVQEHLAGLHPGVIALGSSIARNGASVTKYENPEKSPAIPAFLVEKTDGKSVNVWVRAHVVDQEPELSFTEEEIARFRAGSAKQGHEAAFVTICCTDIGAGHIFRAKGLETLEKHIGEVNLTEYLAKRLSGTAPLDQTCRLTGGIQPGE